MHSTLISKPGFESIQWWKSFLKGANKLDREAMEKEKIGAKPMKFKRILPLAFTFCILSFFTPANSFSLTCEDCLKGLEGVEVLVEEVKAELEEFNLSAIQIQTDVEAKLREAEIKVLSKEENEKIQPLRKPYLYVKIKTNKLPWKRLVVAYSIEISLKQLVILPAQPQTFRKPFFAPTWYKNIVGAAVPKDFPEIREGVHQLTDKFIKAYLAANPKP
jgi:hypothetical protein